MSDFIFSKKIFPKGLLTKQIQSIYHNDKPMVKEFHGDWGSLAVSYNIYFGFQPYESDEHICVIAGGPVFYFQDNKFLTGDDETAGTCAIYNRWVNKAIRWDEDLSGPFAVLIINKVTSNVICVTDLLSFIPTFIYKEAKNVMLSTHIDVLARASGQLHDIDVVSQIDFILHHVVTYPYTSYSSLRQIAPATVHSFPSGATEFSHKPYWVPEEKNQYSSIDQAAEDLKNGLQHYVNAISKHMPHIAQFISGGEDSRVLCALLPQRSQRDAFIFLDQVNREGELAKKTAKIYGANFNLQTRSKTHYLDILPACADLVGSGAHYSHVHTFDFHKSCKLTEYSAVFGGFISDTLLKGLRIKKMPSQDRFPFLPQTKQKSFTVAAPVNNEIITNDVLTELTLRRRAHLKHVQSFREESAEEWFNLWPISMQKEIPNIHGNRRLFRSYEPFTCKEVVKISASVPQIWKLNRRLFHKATKKLLTPSKWLFHGDGRLPYFPWYINSVVQFFMWAIFKQAARKIGLITGNQGPWADVNTLLSSSSWKQAILDYSEGIILIGGVFKDNDITRIIEKGNLTQMQQLNLLQVLYTLQKNAFMKLKNKMEPIV